jgi:hypothetical protein
MEHASIAAFARFILQLLQVGCPPDLVGAAERALADETAHAQICFALATAYAGHPLGPGRLAIDGALPSEDLRAIARTAFVEACIGETCAALEATEAAALATDSVVKRQLTRIATDEARHAELGWQFLRWTLGALCPADRAALARDLIRETERHQRAAPERGASHDDLPATPEHGQMSAAERAAVRRIAIAEVVLPCAQALLATTHPAAERLGALPFRQL